jgi:hypothetical protein
MFWMVIEIAQNEYFRPAREALIAKDVIVPGEKAYKLASGCRHTEMSVGLHISPP